MRRWLAFAYCSKAAVTSIDPGLVFALSVEGDTSRATPVVPSALFPEAISWEIGYIFD
jgi:hypothetical protein